jgi:hypothetical protein
MRAMSGKRPTASHRTMRRAGFDGPLIEQVQAKPVGKAACGEGAADIGDEYLNSTTRSRW